MTRKVESAKGQHGLVLRYFITLLTPKVFIKLINRYSSRPPRPWHNRYAILLPGTLCLPLQGRLHSFSAAPWLRAGPCPPCTQQNEGGTVQGGSRGEHSSTFSAEHRAICRAASLLTCLRAVTTLTVSPSLHPRLDPWQGFPDYLNASSPMPTPLPQKSPSYICLLEAVFLREASLCTWYGRGDDILRKCFEMLLTNTVKLGFRCTRSYK